MNCGRLLLVGMGCSTTRCSADFAAVSLVLKVGGFKLFEVDGRSTDCILLGTTLRQVDPLISRGLAKVSVLMVLGKEGVILNLFFCELSCFSTTFGSSEGREFFSIATLEFAAARSSWTMGVLLLRGAIISSSVATSFNLSAIPTNASKPSFSVFFFLSLAASSVRPGSI